VTVSFDKDVGQGVSDQLGGLDLSPGRRGALGKSMTSYERRPDDVALKATWKGNLGWLLLIAMIVSASILVFITK
jgi:hypothetical protein